MTTTTTTPAPHRQSIRWRGTIRLLTSLSHGAGSSGNIQLLNTEKILLRDGTTTRVPWITGNALKHSVIREPGMNFLVKTLGLEGKLSQACVQLLYAGGFLSAKGGQSIDLGGYLDLCEMIPLLGILGGSLGNTIQKSRIQCDHGLLVCRENVEIGRIPESAYRDAQHPERDLIPVPAAACRSVVGYSRGDPAKQKLALMGDEQKALTVGRVTKGKAKREAGEHPDKAPEATQMRHEAEVVIAGSTFAWEVRGHDLTPIEMGALHSAFAEFLQTPYLGGKSMIGHGKVEMRFPEWFVDPFAPLSRDLAIKPDLGLYMDHLKERADAITKALEAIK